MNLLAQMKLKFSSLCNLLAGFKFGAELGGHAMILS